MDGWPGGEAEAVRRLRVFAAEAVSTYHARRDLLAVDGTSRLSPYLAMGCVSVRQCLVAAGGAAPAEPGPRAWVDELVWREFYRHVLAGFPRVCMNLPFRVETQRIAWRDDGAAWAAWREGATGFPLVDAGMRQLAATGFMHNRARMVTAMFLTKHLLLDWRRGERAFTEGLVDLDFASNNGGWQWSASTGTDPVPYFRVFNPTVQGRRFDPDGVYVGRWVPELRGLPADAIHDPPPPERRRRGYPLPIVEHDAARRRAIRAFAALRG